MKFEKTVILKNGKECIIRSAEETDAEEMYRSFYTAHEETDNLLSYPDEHEYIPEKERAYIKEALESSRCAEVAAFLDGKIVGSAGVRPIGKRYKVLHRCSFGISIEMAYWNIGIGRALAEACIECARLAGYKQMELDVVADNENAIHLYKSLGFTEYGRDPMGFLSRITGKYQEVVYMRLAL